MNLTRNIQPITFMMYLSPVVSEQEDEEEERLKTAGTAIFLFFISSFFLISFLSQFISSVLCWLVLVGYVSAGR